MISEIGKAEIFQLFASASAETHGGVREGCSIKAALLEILCM